MHGTTLGGNPLAMSAGKAVLDTINEEGLLDGATESGQYFLDQLQTLKDKYKKEIKEVRGKGLILGIEFKNNEIAKAVVEKSIDKGLLTILTVQKVMRILPPLNVKKAEIEQAVKTIDKALKEVTDA
jgi:acetylornithine/N-succinyldiaminopimelate aminotransferase